MKEQMPKYTFEEAQDEASRLKKLVDSGKAEDYPEAEKKTALSMSGAEYPDMLKKLKYCPDEMRQEMARRFIEKGWYEPLVDCLEYFKDIDKKDIIERIFDKGDGYEIAKQIEKFDECGIDFKKLLVESILKEKNLLAISYLAEKLGGQEALIKGNQLVDVIIGLKEIEEHGKIRKGVRIKGFGKIGGHFHKDAFYTKENKEKIKEKLLKLIENNNQLKAN